jgi:hypothetical protein
VWLSVLFTDSRWDDTPGLSLPVWEVSVVVDNDVAGLTCGLWTDNFLSGDDLSGERGLVLENVDRNIGLIVVRLSLEKVLGSKKSSTVFNKE